MKPFNLERALAGDPVVTRDGKTVHEVHLFKKENVPYSVAALLDTCIYSYKTDGTFFNSSIPHHSDLFMAPTKGYIIYNPSTGRLLNNGIYETIEEVNDVCKYNPDLKIIEIEV